MGIDLSDSDKSEMSDPGNSVGFWTQVSGWAVAVIGAVASAVTWIVRRGQQSGADRIAARNARHRIDDHEQRIRSLEEQNARLARIEEQVKWIVSHMESGE